MDTSQWQELGTLVALLIGVWVMIDATKRGMGGLGAFLWGLGTFLVACVGLPMWLLFRSPLPTEASPRRVAKPRHSTYQETDTGRCPACGGRVNPEDTDCASCGIHFPQYPDAVPPAT